MANTVYKGLALLPEWKNYDPGELHIANWQAAWDTKVTSNNQHTREFDK
jgi:hypothetical protein